VGSGLRGDDWPLIGRAVENAEIDASLEADGTGGVVLAGQIAQGVAAIAPIEVRRDPQRMT
jgi:hypothetical protein